jgi:hypothetical protein
MTAQVRTAQHRTVVALPFSRRDQESRVLLQVIEVRPDRSVDSCQRHRVVEPDPVDVRQVRRRGSRARSVHDDRNDSFAEVACLLELLAAFDRAQRFLRDQ